MEPTAFGGGSRAEFGGPRDFYQRKMALNDGAAVYRRIIAAIGDGDEGRVRECLAEDIVDHNPIPDQSLGVEGFIEWMRSARASFPDLNGTVEEVLSDGDRVAGRVTWRGTHRGSFVGLAPTGRQISFQAIHIVRFAGGRAAEWWGVADLLGALHQVGGSVMTEPSGRKD